VTARAIQRWVRQSPRKMRLVIDLIRGRSVNEAYAVLRFSKKFAAKQIHKVLKSAVANAEQKAQQQNQPFDADRLMVTKAIVNEGNTLKRFTAAALGRATPIFKRTSHVEIEVAAGAAPAVKAPPLKTAEKAEAKTKTKAKAAAGEAKGGKKAKPATRAKKGSK
jgi:large subunit ribosomal protein L22